MALTHDTRVIVYPNYVNAGRTVAEGRRVPRVPGAEDPTAPEIYDVVVTGLKLPADVENKSYPREALLRGRVRVSLKDKDGRLLNPAIPTRTALLRRIAELLPRHPNRLNKPKGQTGLKAEAVAAAAAAASGDAASTSKALPAKKGGSSKKKR